MEVKQLLSLFDLTDKKADVYLATLELGSGTVIEIAKKSEVKRTTVYDILLDLEKSGLIYQTTKGVKRLFVAEDPERLKKKLDEKERMLNEMLPQLRSLYNVKGIKPKIKFYEGKSGLRQVYDDTLKYGGEILAFASEDVVNVLGKDWARGYIAERTKKNIRYRGIMPRTQMLSSDYAAHDHKQLRTSKLVNAKKYPFTIEINIYGHQKVALMSPKEETGIIIEGKEIYNTIKLVFELLWDNLPKN